ncbi:phage tail tube protein [Azospirillum argentinense]
MADIPGTECLLKVGNAASAPVSYTTLEGQTDTSFDGSTNVANTTAKDNGGWQTGMPTNHQRAGFVLRQAAHQPRPARCAGNSVADAQRPRLPDRLRRRRQRSRRWGCAPPGPMLPRLTPPATASRRGRLRG